MRLLNAYTVKLYVIFRGYITDRKTTNRILTSDHSPLSPGSLYNETVFM